MMLIAYYDVYLHIVLEWTAQLSLFLTFIFLLLADVMIYSLASFWFLFKFY